jgi:F-type H+-transporting ATPase subunit delta
MHKGQPSDLDPTIAPSVFDIDVLRIARVYAQALLEAAKKQDKVDLMQQHFDELFAQRMRDLDNPASVASLMLSSAIPRHRKEHVLRDAFGGRVDDLFLDFLLVLNAHDRLDIVRAVGAEYRELRDQYHNRVRFQVRSAVPLDDAQRERITVAARTRFQKEPVLVEVVDPDLIGGLQIQVGDRLYDLSLKTRLETIKHQLLARSSHEIQRRRDRIGSRE